MCPDVCKGLSDSYGDNFKKLYEDYEKKVCLLNKLMPKIYGLRFWSARLKEEHLIFFIKILLIKSQIRKILGYKIQ